MALAANCFLKYLWWTACYSAWSGIPKMAEQWKAAGAHASFNEWSFVILEASSFILLCSVFRFKTSARILVALASTIVCTALFALALSWIKQGIQ